MINGHGDDLYKFPGGILHNFSTNIPTHPDHSRLISHLSERMGSIASYPEPEPTRIAEMIAERSGVEPGNITVTNGAVEAIYLIAQTSEGGKSAIVAPTFAEYADAARIHHHRILFIEKPEDTPEDADQLWICNPQNPTGEIIAPERIVAIAAKMPKTTIIVDQAYEPFAVKRLLDANAPMEYSNIVILSSFTKRFSVPGLRIGYATSSTDMAAKIRQCRIPWAVNFPAIIAAKFLLNHEKEYPIDALRLNAMAKNLASEMRETGITTTDTMTNFFLAKLPDGLEAAELKHYLATEYRILIRDASNFHGLTKSHFRVAVQRPDENKLLIETIRQWLNSRRHSPIYCR